MMKDKKPAAKGSKKAKPAPAPKRHHDPAVTAANRARRIAKDKQLKAAAQRKREAREKHLKAHSTPPVGMTLVMWCAGGGRA